jgi:hypothetical protein
MKRFLPLGAALAAAFLLVFSCDILKQNNLFEVINKKPEFLVSVSISGYRTEECSVFADPPRQVNNEASSIIATSGERSRFIRWELLSGGGRIGDDSAERTTYTVAARNAELRAVFDRARYALIVNWDASRGAVSASGLGAAGSSVIVDDDVSYALTAIPVNVPQHYFTQWRVMSGQGVRFADASSPSTSVFLAGGTDATIQAAFTAQRVSLYLTAGENGSVEPSSVEPLVAGMNDPYYIQALPVQGASFYKWEVLPNSGEATIENPLSALTSVTCWSADPVMVRALFLLNQYPLTVFADQGGSISSPSSGEIIVTHGDSTPLSAIPQLGYFFTGWSADPAANASFGDPSAASTTVALTGPATVRAGFATISGASVTVSVSNPSIGSLSFSQAELTLAKGATLSVAAPDPALAAAVGWAWYMDGTIIAGQTAASLSIPTAPFELARISHKKATGFPFSRV